VGERQFDSEYHAPVLVTEVAALLASAPRVLDATLGGGGHAAALLEAGAHVTGLDRDASAIAESRVRLARFEAAGRFRAVQASFADLRDEGALGDERFDGILLDLGVSSRQLDDEARGFSFRPGVKLDMRMEVQSPGSEVQRRDRGGAGTAAELLNAATERELARIFRDYGNEPRAVRLAREIVRRRGRRPLAVSDDLVGAIRAVLGPRSGPPDFARLFQAVRIAVNDELGALERALPALRDRLVPGGVLAVITYHSGEDRLVKQAFRDWSRDCICPPLQPACACGGNRALGAVLTRRPVRPAPDEIRRNPRARSSKLRAWRASARGPRRAEGILLTSGSPPPDSGS
jgi:16S rRNA (cytosine1402-N4)-methyltransferase